LYRAYQPSTTDFAFNPAVADNPQIQTQYKTDYQYTAIDIRDSNGNLTGTNYYYWVKNKTTAQADETMSLSQAAQVLQTGDSNFIIFSHAVADTNSASGVAFDCCSIAGIGPIVSDTNSFKLRFLRDFTLRSDPMQLKLKNVHTEWILIRQHQSSKIPQQLWIALTNAVCGQDVIGNQLPSQTYINYDAKYGTSTQYGFYPGQIFVASDLALTTILYTILNTTATIEINNQTIIDYITFMNIGPSTTEASLTSQFFANPTISRNTMNLIYSSARASQVNEIFFNVLQDALASNYEFTDLFKTSLITVNSVIDVTAASASEQSDGMY
jgi:hypothetical protein